ncbi:MAG: hypothetical protein U9N59_03345 [Campylobacterota bacterium]|nr:hypothetical protein [Campylobacterota bacterium]
MSINEVLQSAYELSLEERKELTKILTQNIEDPMLQIDPYFYERREQLHKLRDDIRSGKEPMYDFNESMDELIKELES